MVSRSRGTAGLRADGRPGGAAATSSRVASGVSAANGERPVSWWNRTAPSPYTSAAVDTCFGLRACSGAM